MSHKPRTPEDVCIAYAEAVAEVRRLTKFLNDRDNFCENFEPYEKPGYNTELMALIYGGNVGISKNDCLDNFFSAPKGPDGEFPRFFEYFDKMCSKCKQRHDAIEMRCRSRARLGAAKRAVETVGKRLKGKP